MSESDPNAYQQKAGLVRSQMYCHDCGKDFLAIINYDIAGQHIIECPSCGHKHYRTVKKGRVTSDRFDSDSSTINTRARTERFMWKSSTVPMHTQTISHFLRDKWLNKSDKQ